MKPSAKSRNANSISTLIDTLSERNSLYLMNVDCFCFIDCAVEIVKASWRKSVNDYVKTNLHSKEQLNRNPWRPKHLSKHVIQGHPTAIFGKISVRKMI